MAERPTPEEERALLHAAARASEQGWGIAIGMLVGLVLLLATVVLVAKGGPHPGAHLELLRIYFPGYRVTWGGAFIGFVYGFVVGYAVGRTTATLYNRQIPS
jgi:tetrahydromethanopterin S-methyltransferase subunit G